MKLPARLLAFAALSHVSLAQTTWYVDVAGTPPGTGTQADPFTSIQYAIEQPTTLAGDAVLVSPGMYSESLNFVGKAIVVESTDGPALTVVSSPMLPGPWLPVASFVNAESPGTALRGFTLTEGNGGIDRGGGIWCVGASPLVEDCVVTGNYSCEATVWAENSTLTMRGCSVAENDGAAGIRADGGALLLDGCVVRDQTAFGFGGGVELFDSQVEVQGCTFTENVANFGSAIYATGSTLHILASEFVGNSGASAVWAEGGSITIEGTQLRNNQSMDGGGAARFSGTNATILSSRCESNSAGGDGYPGGAILSVGSSSLQVVDSVFVENRGVRGGAVAIDGGRASFRTCWFEGNYTFDSEPICCGEGGAIAAGPGVSYCVASESVFVRNQANGSSSYGPATGGAATGPVVLSRCTIVDNYARDGGGGVYGGDPFGSAAGALVEDCIVVGNTPDQLAGDMTAIFSDIEAGWPGLGNIDETPGFVDALHDNYHLAPGSPCIDAGNRAGYRDLDGSRPDIGAFPFVDCNDNGIVDAVDIGLGTSADVNTNGFPDECECLTYNYCETSPHSTGLGATMAAGGTTSVSQNDLVLVANACPPNQNGLFFYGPLQFQAPFGDGFRCVFGAVLRLTVVNSGPQGSAAYALNYDNPPQPSGQVTPGSRWNFQFWFRDPQGPGGSGFNLTDGLEVVFCP